MRTVLLGGAHGKQHRCVLGRQFRGVRLGWTVQSKFGVDKGPGGPRIHASGRTGLVRPVRKEVLDGDPAGFLRQFSQILLTFIEDTDQVAFTRLVIAESRRSPWIAEEFYRVGKEPLTKALADCLQRLHETGKIDCPSPGLAAHQFLGPLQEFIIWPQVMAIGPDVMNIPPFDVVVEEGITMFLDRYGVRDQARATRPRPHAV